MSDDLDWILEDDGWHICERCNNGFTTWEYWEDRPQDSGYHEGAEEVLCEDCWEEEEKKQKKG